MKRDLIFYALVSALALQVAKLHAEPPPLIPREVLKPGQGETINLPGRPTSVLPRAA